MQTDRADRSTAANVLIPRGMRLNHGRLTPSPFILTVVGAEDLLCLLAQYYC